MASKKTLFSKSSFWDIQPDYYQSQGTNAWNSSVPYHITSSAKFTASYADMITSFAHDVLSIDPQANFSIFELGAACGKFSYRVLQQLVERCEAEHLCKNRFKYTMCDCSDNTIKFWQSHPQLEPFVNQGMLDFATLMICNKQGIVFSKPSHSWKNTYVIVIANYFFDSIYHDAFGVEKEVPYPYVCNNPNQQSMQSFEDCKLELDTSWPRAFDDEVRNDIAKDHAKHQITKFLLPTGCFDVVDFFLLPAKQAMFISADKGYTSYDCMTYNDNFDFVENGTLSTTVNYVALVDYFSKKYDGDASLSPPLAPSSPIFFSTGLFLTHGKVSHYPSLKRAAKSYVLNNYHCVSHTTSVLMLSSYMSNSHDVFSLLQVEQYDPFSLSNCTSLMVNIVQNCTLINQATARQVLSSMQDRCYFTTNRQEKGEFFATIRLMLAAREYTMAKTFLHVTIDYFGECYDTFLLMGQYHFLQQQYAEAKDCYSSALLSDEDCEESLHYLAIINNTLV